MDDRKQPPALNAPAPERPRLYRRPTRANDMYSGIALGDRVTDEISGFEGIVTGRVEYLSGCAQLLVMPRVSGDGSLRAAEWFDVERLRVTEVRAVDMATRAAGADLPAPTSRTGGAA